MNVVVAPGVVLDDAGDRTAPRASVGGAREPPGTGGRRIGHASPPPRRCSPSSSPLLVASPPAATTRRSERRRGDAAAGHDGPPTGPTDADATGGPATAYDVATGADDVVISVTNEGGFVPRARLRPHADGARHR